MFYACDVVKKVVHVDKNARQVCPECGNSLANHERVPMSEKSKLVMKLIANLKNSSANKPSNN